MSFLDKLGDSHVLDDVCNIFFTAEPFKIHFMTFMDFMLLFEIAAFLEAAEREFEAAINPSLTEGVLIVFTPVVKGIFDCFTSIVVGNLVES